MDFEQSIKNRTTNILLKELIQIVEKNNADLDKNKYNYDQSDSQAANYSGNKRYLKRPIVRSCSALPSPRKRKN